nr:hypothetical protein GCM10020092_103150 [Actinoplanes digitatis]
MPQHGDLVVAADRGEDGPDRRVGIGGHEVLRALPRRRMSPGAGELDRLQLKVPAQAEQGLLVQLGEECGRGEGGRQDRDPVAGGKLRWVGELWAHVDILRC